MLWSQFYENIHKVDTCLLSRESTHIHTTMLDDFLQVVRPQIIFIFCSGPLVFLYSEMCYFQNQKYMCVYVNVYLYICKLHQWFKSKRTWYRVENLNGSIISYLVGEQQNIAILGQTYLQGSPLISDVALLYERPKLVCMAPNLKCQERASQVYTLVLII